MESEAKEALKRGMHAKTETQAKFELVTHQTKVEKIRGNIPMSIHPDSLNGFGREIVDLQGDGDGILGFETARRCLKEMYSALSDIDDAHSSLLKPMQTGVSQSTGKPIMQMAIPPERIPEYNTACTHRNNRLTHAVKSAADTIDAAIGSLDKRIEYAVRHPRAEAAATLQEAAEIRSYIKTELQPHERMTFLLSAAERKDLPVINAVLSVSPWASNLKPEDQARIRDLAHQSFAPREYKHAKALRGIQKAMFDASNSYAAEVAKRYKEVAAPPAAGSAALAKLKGAA